MVDLLVTRTAHLVFAALWAGSVFYVAFVVVPLARDGEFTSTSPLEVISSRLTTISRISSIILLLTGGHLAAAGYTADSLFSELQGQLVLLMVGLWLVLTGVVEVAASRFESGLDGKKIREPANDSLGLFRLAAVVGIALLLVAGALSANVGRLV